MHRQLKEWEHYQEPTVLLVWIDILLSANTKAGWVRGQRINRGELVTSVARIMESTGIGSDNTVREALRKLEQSGEIRREHFGNGTKIIINHFNRFQTYAPIAQPIAELGAQPIAELGAQPIADKQEINNNTISEEKNINPPTPMRVQEKKIGFDTFGIMANVYLKPVQHRQLIETFGEDAVKTTIDELSCKLADGSTDSGNHYATLTYWLNYRKHVDPAKTSGYQKPAPATDPNQETREQREQRLKALWQQASEEDRQSYLDTYHCYPWEREQ